MQQTPAVQLQSQMPMEIRLQRMMRKVSRSDLTLMSHVKSVLVSQ